MVILFWKKAIDRRLNCVTNDEKFTVDLESQLFCMFVETLNTQRRTAQWDRPYHAQLKCLNSPFKIRKLNFSVFLWLGWVGQSLGSNQIFCQVKTLHTEVMPLNASLLWGKQQPSLAARCLWSPLSPDRGAARNTGQELQTLGSNTKWSHSSLSRRTVSSS